MILRMGGLGQEGCQSPGGSENAFLSTPVAMDVIERFSEFWNILWIACGEATWGGCVWLERVRNCETLQWSMWKRMAAYSKHWGLWRNYVKKKPFTEQRSEFNKSSESVLSSEMSMILHLTIFHVNLFCWLIVLWRNWTHLPLDLTC